MRFLLPNILFYLLAAFATNMMNNQLFQNSNVVYAAECFHPGCIPQFPMTALRSQARSIPCCFSMLSDSRNAFLKIHAKGFASPNNRRKKCQIVGLRAANESEDKKSDSKQEPTDNTEEINTLTSLSLLTGGGPSGRTLQKSSSSSAPKMALKSPQTLSQKLQGSVGNLMLNFRTAASEGFGTRARNVASTMEVGDVVVPLCGDFAKRQILASKGVYPGVEYLVCDIESKNITQEKEDCGAVSSEEQIVGNSPKYPSTKQKVVKIRPAYPLRPHLERTDWPVSTSVSEVPLWLSKATYEAGTALGALTLAGTYLLIASILATFVRIAVVPSESMIPALMPGDVVLVTRSILPPKVGEVVFFNPPVELDTAIANSKIGRAAAAAASDGNGNTVAIVPTKGKQFLKRVVGVPGENVGVWNSNPFALVKCLDESNKEKNGNVQSQQCKYRIDNTGPYSRPDVFPDQSWNRMGASNPDLSSTSESSSLLGKGEYFVAGDNGYRSVDSRIWGPLKQKYLFGTAKMVIYPMEHFGKISDGPLEEIIFDGRPGNLEENIQ